MKASAYVYLSCAFGLFPLFAFVSICLLFVQLEGDLAVRVQIVYFPDLKTRDRHWHIDFIVANMIKRMSQLTWRLCRDLRYIRGLE